MLRIDEDCQSPHGEKGICRLLPNCPPLFELLSSAPRPLPISVVNILMTYSCGYVKNEVRKKINNFIILVHLYVRLLQNPKYLKVLHHPIALKFNKSLVGVPIQIY